MEPEPAIACNQVRLPVEVLGHQPSFKTFNLYKVSYGKGDNNWGEWSTNDWSTLGPMLEDEPTLVPDKNLDT